MVTFIKIFVTVLVASFLAFMLFNVVPAETVTSAQAQDTATFFKGKCVVCHGSKAEKKFDASLPDEQLIQVVLKGKKAEKPPHMPEYETKGVTPEQAKELVTYMKQLKASTGE